MAEMVGRVTMPVCLDVGGEMVEVGEVQVDMDLRGVRFDTKTGRMYAVLDMHVED